MEEGVCGEGRTGVHHGVARPVEGDPRAARQDRPAGHDGGLPKKKVVTEHIPAPRQAGNLQHRPGVPVHQRGVHHDIGRRRY